jgi:RNA polymerase sigma factor (sigma-70 family)
MKTEPTADETTRVFSNLLRAVSEQDEPRVNDALTSLELELLRLVSRYGPRACDISALKQAARFGAMKAASKFELRRSKNFVAFARMAIKRVIQDEIDRMRREHLVLWDDLQFLLAPQKIFALEPMCESPARELERTEASTEAIATVRAWVAQRPARQKEYIRLHFGEGLTKAQAARSMGISKAAVTKMHDSLMAAGREELANMEGHLTFLN